ncbi:MAG: hypothetical protein HYT37_04580 [Candidatus Sungbacteria bacterium]|nr:hypothetical protein [Candidatus Sungbacteria bacterium]
MKTNEGKLRMVYAPGTTKVKNTGTKSLIILKFKRSKRPPIKIIESINEEKIIIENIFESLFLKSNTVKNESIRMGRNHNQEINIASIRSVPEGPFALAIIGIVKKVRTSRNFI